MLILWIVYSHSIRHINRSESICLVTIECDIQSVYLEDWNEGYFRWDVSNRLLVSN